MASDMESIMALDLQLSDRETYLIGMIVAHWGTLEHELFTQTMLTFADSTTSPEPLPKAMSNMQFTQVLSLWKERVLDRSVDECQSGLQVVYDTILELKEARDALIHGMWIWTPKSADRVSTVRVKKKRVVTTHFNAEYLEYFALRLAKINFIARYPRGVVDLAAEREASGFYISRKFLGMMTDADDNT